jgi:hypothetical protein
MWVLILLTVNMHDVADIQSEIHIPYHTEIDCEKAVGALSYNLKLKQYKVTALCHEQSS